MTNNLSLNLIKQFLGKPPLNFSELRYKFGLSDAAGAPNWSVCELPGGGGWFRRLRILDQHGEPLSYVFCDAATAPTADMVQQELLPLQFYPDLEAAQWGVAAGLVGHTVCEQGSGRLRGMRLHLELANNFVQQLTMEVLPLAEGVAG